VSWNLVRRFAALRNRFLAAVALISSRKPRREDGDVARGMERALRGAMNYRPLRMTFAITLPALTLLALPSLARAADVDDDDDVDVRTRDTLPEVSSASPSGRFGLKGQKAVSSDAGLSISNISVSGADGSATTLVLRPAIDWFISDSLSIGGFVGVEYAKAPGGSSSAVSVGPRVGYNLPVGARVSVWPKAGLAIARTNQSDEGATLPNGVVLGDEDDSNTSLQLNLFVPVMFHPVQHFFLGLGPALDQDLSGDSKATTVAVRLTLGGWI
jgi:hypothetical protein